MGDWQGRCMNGGGVLGGYEGGGHVVAGCSRRGGMHAGYCIVVRWATVGLCSLQTGCTDVTRLAGGRVVGSELTEGNGTFVGQKLLGLGTGPIDPLVLVTQSNLVHSRGTGLPAILAVGDGAGCGVPLSGSRAL